MFGPENAVSGPPDFADMSLEQAIVSAYGQEVIDTPGSRLKIGVAPFWICRAWKILGLRRRDIKSVTPRGRLLTAHGLAILEKRLPPDPVEPEALDPFDLEQAASDVPMEYNYSIRKLRMPGYRIDLPITAPSGAALDDLAEALSLSKAKVAQLALMASMATSSTYVAPEFATMIAAELKLFWTIRAANK